MLNINYCQILLYSTFFNICKVWNLWMALWYVCYCYVPFGRLFMCKCGTSSMGSRLLYCFFMVCVKAKGKLKMKMAKKRVAMRTKNFATQSKWDVYKNWKCQH